MGAATRRWVLPLVTTAAEGAGRHHCRISYHPRRTPRAGLRALALVRGTRSRRSEYKLTPFPGHICWTQHPSDGADSKFTVERREHEERFRWGTPTTVTEKFADWAARHKLSFIIGSWAVAMTTAWAVTRGSFILPSPHCVLP